MYSINSKIKIACLGWLKQNLKPEVLTPLVELPLDRLDEGILSLKIKSLNLIIENNEDWNSDFSKAMLWLKKNNVQFVTYWDDEYPMVFRELKYPPLILTYKGVPAWLSHRCISVVGSRNPGAYSEQWMQEELTAYLKESDGICLVSGGARGVDQRAHKIAIRCEKPSLCFLPSGIGNVYPSNLTPWLKEITNCGGAVVSQFHPLAEMKKYYFQLRNALIATISENTLIIEAKRKSGTFMTARLAIDYGREIQVLPISPTENAGLGGLDLIFAGAPIVRSYEDINP
ncbi:MAG: DNA-protecting protein DprA [Bdellovibrionaceae bacterium]|jgi:DNA processing protein|nr:DNA-protecting protein DprA [Pseudobdellovibrionaceae bacterium]